MSGTELGRIAAAVEARRRSSQARVQRVHDALVQLARQKVPITYPLVARRAEVSRTFLYENAHARALMADALARDTSRRQHNQEIADAQEETSWRQRALNAEDALKQAMSEIQTQRERIAVLMGEIRDLQQEISPQAAQRIVAANTALQQRVRQLTQGNQRLEERLKAARSNSRFADRRIAQLEAQVLGQSGHLPGPPD
ncbi:DUF6262 family protein [Nonomuraea sp. NBC_00507]|uniref:DUF6262 family protein n=1 Tax=Nonomuraea sp. NBC_00507 TaxID=2976002 RepID=UPI002E1892B0